MKFNRSQTAVALALAIPLLLTTALPTWAQPAVRGAPVTLNFNNAEIEAVARTMAVITGRDVVVDPRVKGTLNLATERAISPAEAFSQFSAALRLRGFAIVESEGLYKVVPEADAKLQTGTVTTLTAGPGNASGNQIVTQVFKLHHESANAVLPVLRPLITPNNSINISAGSNSLVVTDYADNLRRLARLVAALDVPNASDVEVIPLRHSIASDLVPLLQRLTAGGSDVGTSSGTSGGSAAAAGAGADQSFRTSLLADSRSNAIIVRAANPARSQLIRSLIEKLDRPPIHNSNGEAGNIYVVYLKNADAVRLATTLRAAMAAGNLGNSGNTAGTPTGTGSATNNAVQQLNNSSSQSGMSAAATAPVNNANMPSVGGQIQADPSTNSLIITAPEPQYRQLRAVIERLDSRRAQVLIESLIVEVNADKAAEFGVQWQSAVGSEVAMGTNSSLGGQANIINLALGIAAAAANPLAAVASLKDLPRPSTGFNFGVGRRTGGGYALGFLARFLAGNGEGNVLSTPNLMTLDNEEAKIVVGQNVPFVTGQFTNTGTSTAQVNPFQTIERKDVGLTLRVRPQISETGTVKLTVFQEVSTVLPGTEVAPNGPTTTKRSIESSVLVEDGNIIVLGGLLSDEYSSNEEKVPGLGDVPVLGNLFKSQVRNRSKKNLMVFLRPTIVRDSLSSDAVTADRYDMLRALQQQQQPSENIMLNKVNDAPILPARDALSQSDGSRRIEGTRLIPPPLPPARPMSQWDDMRGALPPTADPASQRPAP